MNSSLVVTILKNSITYGCNKMNDIVYVVEELKKILEFDDDQIREEVEVFVSELQLKVDQFEKDMEAQYEMFQKEMN